MRANLPSPETPVAESISRYDAARIIVLAVLAWGIVAIPFVILFRPVMQ